MQHVRRLAGRRLGLERRALTDTEPVLLVDHRHRQVAELDSLLDQGVRADDHSQLAALQPGRDLPPARGRGGPGQERERQVAAEQSVERGEVLLGQRLGGGHQRPLAAVLGRAQHRVQRDDCLARADLAHQQPLHRPARREIAVDRLDRRALVGCERERERGEPGTDQFAQRLEDRGRATLVPRALASEQRELQDQQLLEGEPPPRRLGLRLVLGEVDGGERGSAVRKPLGRPHPAGQALHRLPLLAPQPLDQLAQPVGGDPLRGRVHGRHALGADIVRGDAGRDLVARHPEAVAVGPLAVQHEPGPRR